jgi:hypothetical protein
VLAPDRIHGIERRQIGIERASDGRRIGQPLVPAGGGIGVQQDRADGSHDEFLGSGWPAAL